MGVSICICIDRCRRCVAVVTATAAVAPQSGSGAPGAQVLYFALVTFGKWHVSISHGKHRRIPATCASAVRHRRTRVIAQECTTLSRRSSPTPAALPLFSKFPTVRGSGSFTVGLLPGKSAFKKCLLGRSTRTTRLDSINRRPSQQHTRFTSLHLSYSLINLVHSPEHLDNHIFG